MSFGIIHRDVFGGVGQVRVEYLGFMYSWRFFLTLRRAIICKNFEWMRRSNISSNNFCLWSILEHMSNGACGALA